MGFLSSKKKISVASVVYNLAGDEADRPNYLKSVVLGDQIAGQTDLVTSLQSAYLKGPGIKMRNFFRWAQDNYDYVGMPQGGLLAVRGIDNVALTANIPHGPTETVNVAESAFDVADFNYWAEQWMWANRPNLFNTEWVSDYDDETLEVVITFEDTTETRFVPANFDGTASYIYATYTLTGTTTAGPIVTGPVVDLDDAPFPNVSDWTQITNVVTPHTETLNTVKTVVVTYSDSTPGSTTVTPSSTTGNWTEIRSSYEKSEYQGQHPTEDRLWTLKRFLSLVQMTNIVPVTNTTTAVEDVGGGVTKTTVTTTVTDTIVYDRSTKTDTQDITVQSYSGPKVFIYKFGSGSPALDASVEIGAPAEQYFPFIPARLDNKFIDDTNYVAAYPIVKKAYKKATGGRYDEFIEKIGDNDKIKDIDYTYIVFGVSLNVKENACKEYLYRFFKKLMDGQSSGGAAYEAWKIQNAAHNDKLEEYDTWKFAQSDAFDALFGTPPPITGQGFSVPANEVVIKSSGELASNFDMRITWQSITEETGSGLKEPGRKKGEIWFTQGPNETNLIGLFRAQKSYRVEVAYLNYQVSATQWKRLVIKGMVHRNYIYKGKYVEIGTKEALDDDEESGFIVPFHYDTYREMPLTKSTQMATSSVLAVFNCYVVKKVKWYQTGLFKIILIVVIIAVSIYFPPFGSAGGGILGGGAAVGAALGFSGFMGLLVGAVANFIAASILMKIINIGATLVFGDKIGAIIGAVASMVAIAVGSTMMQGGSFATALSSLSRIDNIMNLASAVGGGIQQYIAASIGDIQGSMIRMQEEYAAEQKKLDALFAENFGYGRASFDAMRLTDYEPYYPESRDTFLTRTLMTGSDNVQMSLSYVTNFATMTLSNDLPI